MQARWLWIEHLGGLQPCAADATGGVQIRHRSTPQRLLLVVLTRALKSKQPLVLREVVQLAGAQASWSVAAATSFGRCVEPEQFSFVTGVLGCSEPMFLALLAACPHALSRRSSTTTPPCSRRRCEASTPPPACFSARPAGPPPSRTVAGRCCTSRPCWAAPTASPNCSPPLHPPPFSTRPTGSA